MLARDHEGEGHAEHVGDQRAPGHAPQGQSVAATSAAWAACREGTAATRSTEAWPLVMRRSTTFNPTSLSPHGAGDRPAVERDLQLALEHALRQVRVRPPGWCLWGCKSAL